MEKYGKIIYDIYEWKCMEMHGNVWKCMEMYGNVWKCALPCLITREYQRHPRCQGSPKAPKVVVLKCIS